MSIWWLFFTPNFNLCCFFLHLFCFTVQLLQSLKQLSQNTLESHNLSLNTDPIVPNDGQSIDSSDVTPTTISPSYPTVVPKKNLAYHGVVRTKSSKLTVHMVNVFKTKICSSRRWNLKYLLFVWKYNSHLRDSHRL